jgi:hypothetical protein
MQTTVRLTDFLMQEARTFARRNNITLTEVIAEGLRLRLLQGETGGPEKRKIKPLPVSKASGGLKAGVNLNDSKALWSLLDREGSHAAC